MNYARVGRSENTNTVTGDELLSSYGRDPCDNKVAWNKECQQIGGSPNTWFGLATISPPTRGVFYLMFRDYAANDGCQL